MTIAQMLLSIAKDLEEIARRMEQDDQYWRKEDIIAELRMRKNKCLHCYDELNKTMVISLTDKYPYKTEYYTNEHGRVMDDYYKTTTGDMIFRTIKPPNKPEFRKVIFKQK